VRAQYPSFNHGGANCGMRVTVRFGRSVGKEASSGPWTEMPERPLST
jgi:hypothetical protein